MYYKRSLIFFVFLLALPIVDSNGSNFQFRCEDGTLFGSCNEKGEICAGGENLIKDNSKINLDAGEYLFFGFIEGGCYQDLYDLHIGDLKFPLTVTKSGREKRVVSEFVLDPYFSRSSVGDLNVVCRVPGFGGNANLTKKYLGKVSDKAGLFEDCSFCDKCGKYAIPRIDWFNTRISLGDGYVFSGGDFIDVFIGIYDENVIDFVDKIEVDLKIDELYIGKPLSLIEIRDSMSLNYTGRARIPEIEDGNYGLTAEITAYYKDGASNGYTYINSIKIFNSNPTLCKELIPGHNNPEGDRINLVFTGFGYEDLGSKTAIDLVKNLSLDVIDFEGDANGLLSVKPFEDYKDKFNFWYIDEIASIDECSDTTVANAVANCESLKSFHCPYSNKLFVNLVNRGIRSNARINSHMTLSIPLYYFSEDCSFLSSCTGLDLDGDGCLSSDDRDLYKTNVKGNVAGFDWEGYGVISECAIYNIGCENEVNCIPVQEIRSDNPDRDVYARGFVHEFGHVFGELLDEYEPSASGLWGVQYSRDQIKDAYNYYISLYGPKNCFLSETYTNTIYSKYECLSNVQWKEMFGEGCGKSNVVDCSPLEPYYNLEVSCIEGCLHFSYGMFRSTFQSLMKNHMTNPFSFGPWNEKLLRDKLEEYDG